MPPTPWIWGASDSARMRRCGNRWRPPLRYGARTRARRQSKIVAAATLFTLLIAAWFIYSMITGVTEPLNAAVDLAQRIAAGEFALAADRLPKRDLGNLLASLRMMSEKLRLSQLEIEEDQRQLEQRVAERTSEVEARTRELMRSVAE